MTADPRSTDAPSHDHDDRGRSVDDGFSWPPSANAVFLFVVVLFALGGPLTYYAVLR